MMHLIAPHRTSSPLLESAPSTPEETQIHRDKSARSTHSFTTFASTDLSSAWTFGSAQRMPIFPSVAPRAVGVEGTGGNHIAPLWPKSKYGRGVKTRGMKALPVLPKSPLGGGWGQETMDAVRSDGFRTSSEVVEAYMMKRTPVSQGRS